MSSSADWGDNGCSSGDAVGGCGAEDNNGAEKVGRAVVRDNSWKAFLVHFFYEHL